MRPIKFRAWDKRGGGYKTPFTLDDATYTTDDDGIHWGSSKEAVSFRLSEDYEIEQFTGLLVLPKEGRQLVDLYEEDIVSFSKDGKKQYGLVWWQPALAAFVIDWQKDKFKEVEIRYSTEMRLEGNSHENPDLLNP